MNFVFNINVCRACMKNEKSVDLCSDLELQKMFTFATRLTISADDNLPKYICSNCIVRLKVAYKFIETAHESENNLQKFLTKINHEFKEVALGNKVDKTTDKYDENTSSIKNEDNFIEDDMLAALIEDQDDNIPSTSKKTAGSVYNNNNVGVGDKRFISPPSRENNEGKRVKLENLCSAISGGGDSGGGNSGGGDSGGGDSGGGDSGGGDSGGGDSGGGVVDAVHQTQVEYSEESENMYLSDNIFLIHSENNEIEFESITPFDDQEQEDQSQEEGFQQADEANDNEQEEEKEEENYQSNCDNSQEQQQFAVDDGNHENLETNSIEVFSINYDDADLSSLHDLTKMSGEEVQRLEELEDGSFQDIQNRVSSSTQIGYLKEYEKMLSSGNQMNSLHGSDMIDPEENSIEEIHLLDAEKSDEEELLAEIAEEENGHGNLGLNIFAASAIYPVAQRNVTRMKITSDRKESQGPPAFQSPANVMNRYFCEQCNRDFSTKTNLNRHMQSHEGNKPHTCPECSKSFSQKSSLKLHTYTHTGEKPYVCKVCNRGFTQCKSLIFHMRRHTGEKPFQCEYCLVMFRQKDALRADNYAIVGDEMSLFQPCEKEDNNGNTNAGDLAEFHLSHHYADDMETVVSNGNITIMADLAPQKSVELIAEIFQWKRGKWENTVFSLRRPDFCAAISDPNEIWYQLVMQLDEKDRKCPPKQGIHIIKHHVVTEQQDDGTEVFICIICQTNFETKSGFKIHMKSHTTNVENIEMITEETTTNEQGQTSRTSVSQSSALLLQSLEGENLNAAIMNVAASSAAEPRRAKKFQCRQCYKCFALQRSLIRHMRIHSASAESDLYAAECMDCDIQFESAEDYQEHLTEQHQVVCAQCPDLIFKRIQDLKSHMYQHGIDQQD